MKTTLTPILFFVAAISLGLMSNSSGRANQGFGASGAPGDGGQVCASCHNSGAFDLSQTIMLMQDGAEVATYEPGKVYNLVVTNTAGTGTPARYGFQVVSQTTVDDAFYNAWSNPASNVHLVNLGNRGYAEHNAASSTNTFMVDWTAPDAGAGDIRFYAAGNAVNGNGNTSGDGATTSTLTIAEAIPSSTDDASIDDILVYPNPATDVINVDGVSQGVYKIHNIMGATMLRGDLKSNGSAINLEGISSGIYLVSLYDNQDRLLTTKRVIKE